MIAAVGVAADDTAGGIGQIFDVSKRPVIEGHIGEGGRRRRRVVGEAVVSGGERRWSGT